MSFPRYHSYKESDVEWLGEVPAHWAVVPFKHVIQRIESGTSVNAVDTPAAEGERGILKTSCVYSGEFNAAENKAILLEEYDRASCPLRAGTLIVSRMNTPDLVGAAGFVRAEVERLYLPDRLWQLHIKNCEPAFAHFWTTTAAYRSQVQMACSGASSSMQNLAQDQLRTFWFLNPPRREQTAIVRFLNRETQKIDALVEQQQQRLIELLKEKRQAVISQAVTKGLDPNVPMKNSGVEWLGEMPEHWTLKRLKRVSPFITVGIVVNPSDFVADEGLPFIYGGDISEGCIDTEYSRRISSHDSERNAKTRLAAGDLLTVRVGAPGVTAVVPALCEGGNCASVMLTRKGDYCSQWLCYAMNSQTVRYQVELVQYGAAQEQFNISHAVNFFVPTPPRDEQSSISAFLDAEVTKIDALISEGSASTTLLQERRAALISAAVTGKIDVRGLVGADAPLLDVVAA